MPFVTDTFTGSTSFEALSSYNANWAQDTGVDTGEAHIGVDAQTYAIIHPYGATGVWYRTESPANANYSVFADIKTIDHTWEAVMGVIGRRTANGTFYQAVQFNGGTDSLRMYKTVGGTTTQLGSSYSNVMTDNVAQTLELRMSGSSISVYLDGTLRIGPVTDTDITGAGKAGITGQSMRAAGIADYAMLDNFSGVDAAGSSFKSAWAVNANGLLLPY